MGVLDVSVVEIVGITAKQCETTSLWIHLDPLALPSRLERFGLPGTGGWVCRQAIEEFDIFTTTIHKP